MGQQERPNDANIEDPRLFKGVIDSIPKINTLSGSVSKTRVIDLLLSAKRSVFSGSPKGALAELLSAKISIPKVSKKGHGLN